MSLLTELNSSKATRLYELFEDAAQEYGVPVEYILAVASRETNMRNILGDGGHGVGVMQIDIRSHPVAATAKANGTWDTPAGTKKLIRYGVKLLRDLFVWAKTRYPMYGRPDGSGWRKIAACAYNAGKGGASRGIRDGDSDKYTTHGDYGSDVLARMQKFADLLTDS